MSNKHHQNIICINIWAYIFTIFINFDKFLKQHIDVTVTDFKAEFNENLDKQEGINKKLKKATERHEILIGECKQTLANHSDELRERKYK